MLSYPPIPRQYPQIWNGWTVKKTFLFDAFLKFSLLDSIQKKMSLWDFTVFSVFVSLCSLNLSFGVHVCVYPNIRCLCLHSNTLLHIFKFIRAEANMYYKLYSINVVALWTFPWPYPSLEYFSKLSSLILPNWSLLTPFILLAQFLNKYHKYIHLFGCSNQSEGGSSLHKYHLVWVNCSFILGR